VYVILKKLKCVEWEFAQGNELEGYFRLLYLRIRRATATPRTSCVQSESQFAVALAISASAAKPRDASEAS